MLNQPKREWPGYIQHMHDRLAAESAEEREVRLQLMKINQCQKLSAESAEQRKARLQELRTNQHERLAAESAEERLQQDVCWVSWETRLQNWPRLAAESAEEREAKNKLNTNIHNITTTAKNPIAMHAPWWAQLRPWPCMSLVLVWECKFN